MTRGNQREKAREKNLKESAGAVSRVEPTAMSHDSSLRYIENENETRKIQVIID